MLLCFHVHFILFNNILLSLHCAIRLAAQCIAIGPVSVFTTCGRAGRRASVGCVWVCHHDNSKLRVSIFTKLGL